MEGTSLLPRARDKCLAHAYWVNVERRFQIAKELEGIGVIFLWKSLSWRKSNLGGNIFPVFLPSSFSSRPPVFTSPALPASYRAVGKLELSLK